MIFQPDCSALEQALRCKVVVCGRSFGTFSEATASAKVARQDTAAVSPASGGECPSLILGTMTFGWSKASQPVDDIEAWRMVRTFRESGGGACIFARLLASVVGLRVVLGLGCCSRNRHGAHVHGSSGCIRAHAASSARRHRGRQPYQGRDESDATYFERCVASEFCAGRANHA